LFPFSRFYLCLSIAFRSSLLPFSCLYHTGSLRVGSPGKTFYYLATAELLLVPSCWLPLTSYPFTTRSAHPTSPPQWLDSCGASYRRYLHLTISTSFSGLFCLSFSPYLLDSFSFFSALSHFALVHLPHISVPPSIPLLQGFYHVRLIVYSWACRS
jgi:hypothetical protein